MGFSLIGCLKTWRPSGGKSLKKTASLFTILTAAMIIFVSISFNIRTVKADGNYSIEHVSHTAEILYNGYIFINDTVSITGQAPNDFLIGFPDKYGSHVLKCIAYSGSENFPVTLNVPMDNRMGFYGVRVNFPQGAPQVFTIGFVLSNTLLTQNAQNATQYALDFPAFPSLTQAVASVNGSIALPGGAAHLSGNTFNYSEANLMAFTHNASSVSFSLNDDGIQIVDVDELKREIKVNEFGEIEGADTYVVTNRAEKELSHIEVFLPPNASNPSVFDQLGRRKDDPKQIDEDTNRYMINFTINSKIGQSTTFTVKYSLPSFYLTQEGSSDFALRFSMFQLENYYVNHASIALALPEGARIMSFEGSLAGDIYNIERSVFQETVTIDKQGIVALGNFSIGIMYEYNRLWLSFRPTTWVWALAIVGCAIAAVAWRMPKGPVRVSVPTGVVKLRPEYLKSFLDAYEEKQRIDLELASLEARVQKGKIPRRRYKVRTKTLETRLATLSRNLAEFKERMRAAGGQYARLMVELEVAETEINEVATNIKNAEALHNQGQLSFEAYRNRLADYKRTKENAETTINGILLRLREETR
jgi:hypothetical protein